MKALTFFKTIFLILIVLIISCKNQTDLEEAGFKGKVKSVHSTHTATKNSFGVWESTGKVLWSETANYDEKGKCISITIGNNKVIPKYEKEILVEQSQYTEDGRLISTAKFQHNSENELEINRFNENGKKEMHEVITYKNKKAIKDICSFIYSDDTVTFTNYLVYDEKGNVSEQKRVDKTGEQTFNFEYIEFDDKKNWTKRLTYINHSKEPSEILIRQFEYYGTENANNKTLEKKLDQRLAENTIKKFISENSFSEGNWQQGSFNIGSINSFEPIVQFTESEASSKVSFNFQDSFSNDKLTLKFNFKRNIDKHWFLVSVEAISGIGSQGMSDRIQKWQDINLPVQ